MSRQLRYWLSALLVSSAASCTFDREGTGAERSTRARSQDSGHAQPDSDAREGAAEAEADRARAGARTEPQEAGTAAVPAPEAQGSAGLGTNGGASGNTAAPPPPAATAGAGARVNERSAADGGANAAPDARVIVAVDDGDAGGDDSDAGAEPPLVADAGMSGASGVADANGAAGASGRGGEGGAQEPDRQLVLALLELTVSVLRANPDAPVGDLLTVLASAGAADAGVLATVLSFVDDAEDCGEGSACEQVCELVAMRCRRCADDDACRAALRSTCGDGAAECR